MRFTDLFVERPVLASVVSLFVLVLGLRSVGLLPVRQFPETENAVVTVSTVYTGADPQLVAGFILASAAFGVLLCSLGLWMYSRRAPDSDRPRTTAG